MFFENCYCRLSIGDLTSFLCVPLKTRQIRKNSLHNYINLHNIYIHQINIKLDGV